MRTRGQIHQLLDAVPDDRLPDLEAAIESLADPIALAIILAPEDDEPVTEEDLEALREADEAIARGDTLTHEEVLRRLGS